IPQLYSNNKKQRNLCSIAGNHRVCLASTERNADPIHGYHRQLSYLVIKRTLDTVHKNVHRPPTLLLPTPSPSSTHTNHRNPETCQQTSKKEARPLGEHSHKTSKH